MQEIQTLAEEFAACKKILLAFGDENRQHLILEIMKSLPDRSGSDL